MKKAPLVGHIVKNRLCTGDVIVCRVMELNVAGTNMVRVTDVRETQTDAWLIAHGRTWAAPLENLEMPGMDEGPVRHRKGLVLIQ